jgi:putative MATE family efflux protein
MTENHKTQKPLDLTTGNITRNIFSLAWPAVATMFLETAFALADAFWVGKLGAVAMASVISSQFIIWIIYSLMSVISTGVVAMVARYVGAKDEEKAVYVSQQAVFFSILVALTLTLVGIASAEGVFILMGTEPQVTHWGSRYLRITYLAATFFFLIDVFGAIFRASGDTKTPMRVVMAAIGLNIILDPFLIFGWGPFPRWGTDGAALATFLGQGLGALLYFILIKKGKLRFKIDLKPKVNFDFSIIKRIVRIGLPTSISGIIFSIVYVFINKITALFGTESIAALGIGNRLESVSYLTCFGFSIAAATLVGQNLGAKKPERAAQSAWRTVWIVSGITGIISLIFLSFPKTISSFFISDPKVIEISIDYLRILALSQIFMGLEIVLEGTFSGAGNTIPPMVVSVPGSVARIPLAYLIAISLGVGVNGIWWAITLTTVVKGIVLALWFRKGKWKKKKI